MKSSSFEHPLSAAHLVSRHPSARRKERHIHNLARLVRYKGRRRCGQIKSAPLRRSRTRHDQAPLEKSGRGAQSGGIRLARYTLRNRPPSFSKENWSFSFEARYTVTRITLFRFADTTSMSVPQSKDFPGARESASPPRSTKINIPAASAPRTAKLYHFPSPRVNCRARPNWREVSDTPRQNANSAPAANPMRNHFTPYICSEQIYLMSLPNRRRLPVRRKAQLLDRNRRAAVEQVFQTRLPPTLRRNAPQAVATNRKDSKHSVIADFNRRMPRRILLRNLGTDCPSCDSTDDHHARPYCE